LPAAIRQQQLLRN